VSNPAGERELEAMLAHSRQTRAKLDRLHEVLTSTGHYGRGATPATVVYRENKLRLLRLLDESGQPRTGPPVLFVPAPVSRYFIVDLLPGRSFAGHVAEAGFDVYIVDFGTPADEDRFADLEYFIEGLVRRCVRKVSAIAGRPSINIVGYCLGGTLSLLYTALHPSTVSRLVLLTTMIDADVKGGIAWVAHQMGLAGESYDDPRLVPAVEIKGWFEMLAPGSNSVIGRVNDLWQRLDDPIERLRDVRTMSTWVDDVVPAPGRLLAELYQQFGPGRNRLIAGTAVVGPRAIDCSQITMPVLSVSAAKDLIAPAEGVDAVRAIIPHAHVMRLPGGHVGIVAGRTALSLWQRTVAFLSEPAGNGILTAKSRRMPRALRGR
jgi:polyhydroxyalkanoate synthase subunit PhaC